MAPSTSSAAAASSAEVEAADEALRGTRLRPQGRLRIDVPVVFGRLLLTPALPRFQARYPDLQLEVQFNDRKIDLIAEEVDLVVRVGAVREPQLIARRAVTTRLITCASPEYLRAHGVPDSPEALRRHKLIAHLGSSNHRPFKWLFQRGRQRRQLSLPFSVAFNSVEAQVQAAIRGAGHHAGDGPGGGRSARGRQARGGAAGAGRRRAPRSRW